MEIITDINILNIKSENVKTEEINDLAINLTNSIPKGAYGLAAPQIGIHKRAFITNLSFGTFVFINPKIIWTSVENVPSTEACLSLPGIQRCIERKRQITITYDYIISSKDISFSDNQIRVKDLDAFILQHELDHLDGILITDHSETKSHEKKFHEKQEKRRLKIEEKREQKKLKVNKKSQVKISSKTEQKNKKLLKKTRRQKISVKIEERYKAEHEGLINSLLQSKK